MMIVPPGMLLLILPLGIYLPPKVLAFAAENNVKLPPPISCWWMIGQN